MEMIVGTNLEIFGVREYVSIMMGEFGGMSQWLIKSREVTNLVSPMEREVNDSCWVSLHSFFDGG